MSVVKFPEPPTSNGDLIWVCKCGCSSFELFADGRTQCCYCNEYSTGADDTNWREALPNTPAVRNPAPDNGIVKVTRIGSSNSALKDVCDTATTDTTVCVIIVQNSGLVRTWGSEAWYVSPEVAWLDERIASARRMLISVAEGVK